MPLVAAHQLPLSACTTPIYNALDSGIDLELDETLSKDMTPESQLAYDFERGMQGPALDMMLRGFRVDPGELDKAIRQTEAKYEATLRVLNTLSQAVWDRDVNPESEKQLKDLFYNHMGVPVVKKYFKGEVKEPMDRNALEKIEQYFYPRPIVNAILLARDLRGQLTTLKTEIDDDGVDAGGLNWRWRCSYNIAGAATFRWSSSKSTIGTGSNFQNLTEELRRIFIPDPGWKLYGIDGEQAEARDVGWYCGTVLGDWSYFDACQSGDVHTYISRLTYPEWPWTGDLEKDRQIAERRFYRHFTYRYASKKLGHGTNYYGKPPTLSAQTKIPLPFVKEFQARYFDAFPCIPAMHQHIAQELQTKQRLVNAFGIARDFFGKPTDDETLRKAVAHMFQSSTLCRLSLGLWRTWKHLGTRVQLLSQLHDAFYFQARVDDDEEEILSQVKDLFEVPLYHQPSGRKFIVPGEIQGGFNWGHRYKLDEDGNLLDWNPRGLDKITVN